MKNAKLSKRYIDDGAGTFTGTIDEFRNWINLVNIRLSDYGLYVDEFSVKPVEEYIPFLDVQFCFDSSGQIQPDLYTKSTDSRSYLNFNSTHPNHIYSGIVFSQCLRLHRIINDTNRLETRLRELKTCFRDAGYPATMIENISQKVLRMERSLNRHHKTTASN